MLAIHINRAVGPSFQGEEFAAGLMHDFGRTLIAVSMPEQFSIVDPLHFGESSETPFLEKRVIGTSHGEAGAWFAEISHLPSESVEVIRYHHQLAAATRHRRLVALASIADHMASYLQRFDDASLEEATLNLKDPAAAITTRIREASSATPALTFR